MSSTSPRTESAVVADSPATAETRQPWALLRGGANILIDRHIAANTQIHGLTHDLEQRSR